MAVRSSEFMPFLAMVIVQVGYAGMNVSSKVVMDAGMPPLVLVAYRQIFATFTIIPFAYFLERKTRPKITKQVLLQIFWCSLFGASLNQIFYFVGLKHTTATVSCALTNLLPAITFLLAVPFGLESVAVKKAGGRAKLLGTSVGISGAMLLSFYHGPIINIHQPNFHLKFVDHPMFSNNGPHQSFVLGPLSVLAAVLAMAVWFILQARMSESFTAPYTSSALLCFMASFQCIVIAVCTNHNISDWSLRSRSRLVCTIYAGVVGTALAFCLMSWTIQRKGPLYVSVFSPLLLVLVALVSWSLRLEKLYTGTAIGSAMIVMGLYIVLWGKSKEMVTEKPKLNTNAVLDQKVEDLDLEKQHQLADLKVSPGDQ